MRPTDERAFWDQAASTSMNLRNEWICDSTITDDQCLQAITPHVHGKILDVGCGIGRLTMGFGVDISAEMLARATPGNEYELCDGRTLPYDDETFDCAFSVFLFQHLSEGAKFAYCEEVSRALRPGGIFRLQIVTDADLGDYSQPISVGRMSALLWYSGLEVASVENHWLKEQWSWITAVKTSMVLR